MLTTYAQLHIRLTENGFDPQAETLADPKQCFCICLFVFAAFKAANLRLIYASDNR